MRLGRWIGSGRRLSAAAVRNGDRGPAPSGGGRNPGPVVRAWRTRRPSGGGAAHDQASAEGDRDQTGDGRQGHVGTGVGEPRPGGDAADPAAVTVIGSVT